MLATLPTLAQSGQADLPLLLTVAQVSELTQLSRSFVYERMNDGTLPSVKIGRSRRIKASDVRKLIDESTVG